VLQHGTTYEPPPVREAVIAGLHWEAFTFMSRTPIAAIEHLHLFSSLKVMGMPLPHVVAASTTLAVVGIMRLRRSA